MKGYYDFSIGDRFQFFNGLSLEIRDYSVVTQHNKPSDYRTKKVDTVVWCLFAANGIEYRKTSEQLSAAIKNGTAIRISA